jgi:serine/threonine-protein kinase
LLKGSLPMERVFQYAIEIADALDSAHRKGITHRDLKPGSIILTKSGAKLLDFGLAKLRQEAGGPVSGLSTTQDDLSGQGAILGTLQYMAPEQVEGKTEQLDARTNIFAFGAVVYEMATGKRAFEGKSQASVIAKILENDPPPVSSLRAVAPAALDHVVKKGLAKEPEKRWQAASDLCDELRWIAEGSSQIALAPASTRRGSSSLGRRAVLLSLVTLLLGAAIASLIWHPKPSSPPPVTRTVISLSPGQQLAGPDIVPAVAFSPDGTHLVYVARQGATQQLYLRTMDSLEAKPIPDTEGGVSPFFSPDGQWVGFFAGGKLKKVSVSGGGALTLASAANPHGASWGSRGVIAFVPAAVSALQQVSDAGVSTQPLTRLERVDLSERWPEFLPGGIAVLFGAGATPLNFISAQVAVQSVETGERR